MNPDPSLPALRHDSGRRGLLRRAGTAGLLTLAARIAPARAAERAGSPTAIDRIIDEALDGHRVVGTVVLVARHGSIEYQRAAGLFDRESRRKMKLDSVFRLASVSKPCTTLLAMRLLQDGRLKLDDPVARFLPWFVPRVEGSSAPAPITIEHLLTHTAGLDYGFQQAPDGAYARAGVSDGLDERGGSLEDNLKRLASVPLDSQPGARWRYSLATDVLGAVVAAATGRSLPEAMVHEVTRPLRLPSLRFNAKPREALATPYVNSSSNGPIERMASPHVLSDPMFASGGIRVDPRRAWRDDAFPSGGGGMIGNARDVLAVLEAFRAGDFIREDWRGRARHASVGANAATRGPGWGFSWMGAVLVDPAAASSRASAGTVAWGGVYGHSWMVDFARGLTLVALTNTTLEGMAGKFANDLAASV